MDELVFGRVGSSEVAFRREELASKHKVGDGNGQRRTEQSLRQE